VAPPRGIAFIPGALELTLNGSLAVAVRLTSENGLPFDNCSALPLDWQVADDSIIASHEAPHDSAVSALYETGACGVRILHGLKEGSVQLTVRYNHLHITTTISVFQELQVREILCEP
jgi:hypothetical protein